MKIIISVIIAILLVAGLFYSLNSLDEYNKESCGNVSLSRFQFCPDLSPSYWDICEDICSDYGLGFSHAEDNLIFDDECWCIKEGIPTQVR